MEKYTLIGFYKNSETTTCDHCGTGIKNVCLIKDNLTCEVIKVGTTCIHKLMNLTEDFNKRLQKEIEKYYKLEEEFEIYKDKENTIKKLIEEGQLNKTKWDERNEEWVKITLEDVEKMALFLYKNTKRKFENQVTLLNKLNKKGLINIEV